MKTLIILMFIMLIVLLALNVTLYLNFNKRLNNLRSLCTTSFNDFIKESADVYSHINSIYQTIKDLMNTVSKFKTVLDVIELKSDNIVNNITTYVHKDNDNRNKEIINCLANTSNDLRTLINDVNKRVLDFKAMYITDIDNRTNDTKAIIDDIKTIKLLNSTINNSINYINDTLKNRVIKDNEDLIKVIDANKIVVDNIYQTVHNNTVDIKEVTRLISNLDLTKISSAFEKLQNAVNYTDEQKETPTELKTATKSKSTKSGKPASKKKTPLL